MKARKIKIFNSILSTTQIACNNGSYFNLKRVLCYRNVTCSLRFNFTSIERVLFIELLATINLYYMCNGWKGQPPLARL